MKMPWAEAIFDLGGSLTIIPCKFWTKIKCKEKIIVPKWNSLEKHVRKRKNE
jgi:hypothetical protein